MPEAKKRKFDTDSPFTTIEREVNQDALLRRPLIKKLEEAFGGKVVCYFTSFGGRRNAAISDSDAEILEGVLSVEHTVGKKLLLVINSPGGQGLAAERIVNTCRAYSGGDFEVIVPHMAKSAATMICFGAAAIHMSKTAELGPVDPQVPYWPGLVGNSEEEPMWISAEEYVRSYDKLIESSASGAARIEPFIQQLNRYDSRYIEQLRSAQDLAKDISVRMLANGMMKGIQPIDIQERIKAFLSQLQKSSHGRMITASEAEECGLKIKLIDLQSDVWHDLWELYVRSNWSVTNRCSKLIETSETALAGQ